MSIEFSNPTLESGICELIDANCGTNLVSYPKAKKVVDVNLAIDAAVAIAIQESGKAQFDDTNHTDYPIITLDLVGGRRDYSFTTDENGNLILDYYKVVVKSSSTGEYYEVGPVDVQSDPNMNSFFNGNDIQGAPSRYDKTGNGLFLDPIPENDVPDGLKIYINREGSHFTSADTTKMPGFPGVLHEYFAIRPSYFYALRKGLKNKNDLFDEMIRWENKIRAHFGSREKDTRSVLKGKEVGFR